MNQFDWEARDQRIAQQVEAATAARLRKEMRQLRDDDRRFYRLGMIIFLVCLPLFLGPLRYGIDLAFDNIIPPEFSGWRKFAIIPMLLVYSSSCAMAIWAIFHRRY